MKVSLVPLVEHVTASVAPASTFFSFPLYPLFLTPRSFVQCNTSYRYVYLGPLSPWNSPNSPNLDSEYSLDHPDTLRVKRDPPQLPFQPYASLVPRRRQQALAQRKTLKKHC
jgi:hypothetical protein